MPRPTERRILGIDSGIQRTGWGVVERVGPRCVAVAYGVVRTHAEHPIETRLLTIHDGLLAVIDEQHPDAGAIEDIFVSKHARSALILGEARGVALLALARRSLSTYAYPPALVKRSIAGRGAAPKEQMQHVVRAVLGLRELPPPDAADALAVAICHANAALVTAALDRR